MTFDPFEPELLARLPSPPRKVVLLRASRIGDFLCATPALRALRARLPEAEITMITVPLLVELAQRLPSLDRAWPFTGFPGIAEQLFDARQCVSLFQKAQDERFDLAIQMQGTGVYSNAFLLLLGASANAGFVRPGDPPGLLNAALSYPHGVHEIDCVLALSTFLGAPTCDTELEFPLLESERERAAKLLAEWPRPWIGFHPSARDETRRWPLERYQAVAESLRECHGGTIVLLGDDEALSAGEWLAQRLPRHHLNLIGQLSLPMLGALIERLDLLITNDSGPAHIAYALRVPTVTLFGKRANVLTNGPLQPGPFRLLSSQSPSPDQAIASPKEIDSISVEQVFSAAQSLLS